MSSGDQPLFFVLGDQALRTAPKTGSFWSVQHRHEDGHRWFDVAHYLTKGDAEAAVARALERFPDEELRVEHVRRPS